MKGKLKRSRNTILSNISRIDIMVKSGDCSALEAFLYLKEVQDTLKSFKDNMLSDALDEAGKYDGKSFQAFDMQFQIKEAGARWDFSPIPEIGEKEKELKKLKDDAKALYKSTLGSGKIVLDEESGEIDPAPIHLGSKTTIAISQIKQGVKSHHNH